MIQQLASASSASATDWSALEASTSALKSSISALESSIQTLEGSSGRWEGLGWVFALMVFAGVAGELAVIVREYLEDLESWKRGIVRPPDRPSFKLFWFDIIATVLVVVGVFGEFGTGWEIASINSHLRSKTSELRAKSDQLLALVTREAGTAKTSAEGAAAALGSVETRVSALDARINVASSKLDVLEGRLAWRTISPNQYQRAKKVLARFKGSSVVIISASPLGDREPPEYAKQVAKVFTDSGWSVDLEPRRTRSYSPPGVECRGKSTPAGIAAEKFCESLPDVGFRSSQLEFDAPYVEQIIIREKPSP